MTWGKALIRDVASFVMGQAPPGTEVNEIGLGTPFFRSGEFEDIRPKIAAWTTKPLRLALPTDVFVCVVGANAGEVNRGADGAIGRSIGAVRSGDRLDHDYLYYFLRSIEVYLRNAAQGSAQAVISKDDLGRIEIPLPVLEEQRAIAGVLGALDDKIESNRRIVRTAREFIDALFYTAFSDGEINVQVSSLAEVIDCLHTKKPDQSLEGKQLLQLSNISDDGFLILGNHYPISLDDYNKWTANIEVTEGDVILTNVGRVGALARLPKGVKAALGRNMTAIRARKPSDALFIFAALNNAQVRRGMKSLIDVGTIMDALNVHAIRRILLPGSTALQRDSFALAIRAVVERAEVAVKESSGLESLRDALLPELLSGRLRVKDAESMMENV